MEKLLVEIGTEEIPAGYIQPALKAFSATLIQKLDQFRIEYGDVRTFGTPRRLTVQVGNVAGKQQSLVTEVFGPPENIGFDENGKPTLAAQKFAEKIGVSLKQITTKETQKGSYLCAVKKESGLSTTKLLSKTLPQIILATPFPKTMKWSDLPVSFARPIHSVLALLGDRVIPFNLGNIKSGRYTFGHSFVSPARIKINHPSEYIEKLCKAHVLVDIAERRKLLESEIQRAAAVAGGRVLPDDELAALVNNLVEYPVAVLGQFDEKYLKLPREILITAMREHQKYFAVTDSRDHLMPCFVAVNNTPVKDRALVAKGHERVLRARLEDARFFYQSDLTEASDNRVEKLRGVLFQAELGTVFEKTLRLGKLIEFLAEAAKLDSISKKSLQRAAFLCKSDLVSQVVGEFPKLQGIMGRVYALNAGESEAVALAIEEHYQPTYSGGELPKSSEGAILSIADKMDSICGCFHVGLLPTGASDPYALRRQGIGTVQIMLTKEYAFSLRKLIEASAALFIDGKADEFLQVVEKVYGFLKDRIAYLLSDEGFSKDVIAAVVSVSVNHVPHVWKRVKALQALKSEPDFEPLAVAFKRVVNILKQARYYDAGEHDAVDKDLFEHTCEHDLLQAFQRVNQIVSENLAEGSFDKALLNIASLREPVDAFFDGVLVMTEDPKIRINRLKLLGKINALFGRFADFSKIST